jgi:uncharacterized protein
VRLRPALRIANDTAERAVVSLAGRSQAAAQAQALSRRAHRPWPVPDRPWVQGQTWRDLLFAHWSLPEDRVRAVVPDAISIDTFDGHAWIAVTPFEVTGLRLRGTLPVPILSRFPEINVRTYVTVEGRPGIYFFSLDAASALAVAGARATYHLPYFRSRMALHRVGPEICYASTRVDSAASLRLRYRPTGAPFLPREGTLEHFLTERYCLYTVSRGRIHRAEIHHPPWALQAAEAHIDENTMAQASGIDLPAPPPLLHFAGRQDVVIWPLTPVAPSH